MRSTNLTRDPAVAKGRATDVADACAAPDGWSRRTAPRIPDRGTWLDLPTVPPPLDGTDALMIGAVDESGGSFSFSTDITEP